MQVGIAPGSVQSKVASAPAAPAVLKDSFSRHCSATLALVLSMALGLLPGIAVAQAIALDFRSAFERMNAQNEDLAAARTGVDQALSRQREADASRLPSIELEGGVTRLNSPLELDLSGVRRRLDQELGIDLPPGLIPSGLPIQDRSFSNAALIAVQPIYLGGRISAGREAARAGVSADRAVVERKTADLLVDLVQRYFGQIVAADVLAVRQQSVDTLQTLAFNARRLEEEGEISRAERLRADVALIEAQGELSLARERLALAQSALSTLLAEDRPVDPLTRVPAIPQRIEAAAWRVFAADANPALLELGNRIQQAEALVRVEQAGLRPSVFLLGRRELYSQDLSVIEPDWALSLRLSWRFFDGGVRRARVSSAEAGLSELEFLRASLRRQIGLVVDQQVQAQHTALERHVTFSAAKSVADESLRVQRLAFEQGFATSLEVIEAELARSRIALAELFARYEAWVATASIHAASGQAANFVDLIEDAPHD
ncbi:MAG: TolC family protein [Wenzhouxiangella sp.]